MKLKGHKGKAGRKPRFTNDQIVRILELKRDGSSNKEVFVMVAKEFNVKIGLSYLTKAAGHYHRLKELIIQRLADGDVVLRELLEKNKLIW